MAPVLPFDYFQKQLLTVLFNHQARMPPRPISPMICCRLCATGLSLWSGKTTVIWLNQAFATLKGKEAHQSTRSTRKRRRIHFPIGSVTKNISMTSETHLLYKSSVVLQNIPDCSTMLIASSTVCKATPQLKKRISQRTWGSGIRMMIVFTHYSSQLLVVITRQN